MRYIVATVCIDEHGKYSLDLPSDEPGIPASLATTTVGEGELDAAMFFLHTRLKNWHERLSKLAKQKASNDP